MNKKGITDFLAVLVFFICIVGGIGYCFISSVGASQGSHTGIITAVEHNSNLIFPADIVYFKTNGQSSQEDIYCIESHLIPMAKEMSKQGYLVTIDFKNDFLMYKWDCNGGSTIINKIHYGDGE